MPCKQAFPLPKAPPQVRADLERERAKVALVEKGLHQALHQRVGLLGLWWVWLLDQTSAPERTGYQTKAHDMT